MGRQLELPKLPAGDTQKQLETMYSYLYQMAVTLNNNLAEIGGTEFTDQEMQIVREVVQSDESSGSVQDSMKAAETLKSLIIKTAKFVKSQIDQYNLYLTGSYVAEGKLGKYVRNTKLDVDVTPTGIQQNYSFQEIIQGLKTYEINAKNYIKTGLLRTVSSIPVYGVAIGKDVVTFAEDGTETYNDSNKVAELTAAELSFYQGGSKIASYKGNRIGFYYNGTEKFYIASGKIYCADDLELASGKKLIINTSNFKIDSSGNVTVKGGGEFTGELKAATGTFKGTVSAGAVISCDISADRVTSGTMSAARIQGGTLSLGGNNNGNGVLKIYNASGSEIGKWDKDGINASAGTFSGTVTSGAVISCDISADRITSGSMSAARITSGTMSAARIQGGTLSLGGNNNGNGILKIYNASGSEIGKWDKDGISASSGTFSGTVSGATVSGSTISGNSISGGTISGSNINTDKLVVNGVDFTTRFHIGSSAPASGNGTIWFKVSDISSVTWNANAPSYAFFGNNESVITATYSLARQGNINVSGNGPYKYKLTFTVINRSGNNSLAVNARISNGSNNVLLSGTFTVSGSGGVSNLTLEGSSATNIGTAASLSVKFFTTGSYANTGLWGGVISLNIESTNGGGGNTQISEIIYVP